MKPLLLLLTAVLLVGASPLEAAPLSPLACPQHDRCKLMKKVRPRGNRSLYSRHVASPQMFDCKDWARSLRCTRVTSRVVLGWMLKCADDLGPNLIREPAAAKYLGAEGITVEMQKALKKQLPVSAKLTVKTRGSKAVLTKLKDELRQSDPQQLETLVRWLRRAKGGLLQTKVDRVLRAVNDHLQQQKQKKQDLLFLDEKMAASEILKQLGCNKKQAKTCTMARQTRTSDGDLAVAKRFFPKQTTEALRKQDTCQQAMEQWKIRNDEYIKARRSRAPTPSFAFLFKESAFPPDCPTTCPSRDPIPQLVIAGMAAQRRLHLITALGCAMGFIIVLLLLLLARLRAVRVIKRLGLPAGGWARYLKHYLAVNLLYCTLGAAMVGGLLYILVLPGH